MSNSVIFTFLRHGQSTDNARSVWGGWVDAPLSNHGMNQARALGDFFADTPFTAIHTSDLKRAYSTARALYDGQGHPKPSFDSSELLREQNFGDAGRHPIFRGLLDPALTLEDHMAKGIYPVLRGHEEKFPKGESTKDLNERAKTALAEYVLPHVYHAAKAGKTGIHVAVVCHGVFINSIMLELLKMSTEHYGGATDYHGMLNTAWTRVAIDIKGAQEGKPIDVDKEPLVLVMRVTDVNRHKHIDNIKQQ